jgi:REP element-mobilizing transposase RayT
VKIMKGHVSKDHVHLLVSIPPQVTITHLLQLAARKVRNLLISREAIASEANL